MPRWLVAECFVDIAGDLRTVPSMAAEREPDPSAAVLPVARSVPRPKAGRAGYDGAKRKIGSNIYLGTDPMGYPIGVETTPAELGDRNVLAP